MLILKLQEKNKSKLLLTTGQYNTKWLSLKLNYTYHNTHIKHVMPEMFYHQTLRKHSHYFDQVRQARHWYFFINSHKSIRSICRQSLSTDEFTCLMNLCRSFVELLNSFWRKSTMKNVI